MPLKMIQAKEGVYIPVRVSPGSKRSSVEILPDALKLKVKSPPLEGRANQEIIGLLSEFFNVPKSRIKITRGLTGKKKTVFIEGLTADLVSSFLAILIKNEKLPPRL